MLPLPISDAYIAGFFDGEGSIGIYRASEKRGYHLRTQLTQNNTIIAAALLDHFCERFGGNVSVQTTTHGTKLNWQANGLTAAAFLDAILPHLILKADQTALALKWFRARPKPTRCPRTGHYLLNFREVDQLVYQAMRDLKKSRCDTEQFNRLLSML